MSLWESFEKFSESKDTIAISITTYNQFEFLIILMRILHDLRVNYHVNSHFTKFKYERESPTRDLLSPLPKLQEHD